MKKLSLITTSDWHLRTTVPPSRGESDWYSVMESRLRQIAAFGVPVVIAGDLFDRHDPPSSLVSWAIRHLPPDVFAIPGQHDLLGHSLQDVGRGAFGALLHADVIRCLPVNSIIEVNGIYLYAMPWGSYTLPERKLPSPSVCVVHKYVWADPNTKYLGAHDDARVTAISDWAKYFDYVVIGDNHIAWRAGKFLNHGSLFSMSSAQFGHIPLIGKFYDDGSFESVPFPEENIDWAIPTDVPKAKQTAELLSALSIVQSDGISFITALSQLEERLHGKGKDIVAELRREIHNRN